MSPRVAFLCLCAFVLAACETRRPEAQNCPNLTLPGDQALANKSGQAYEDALVDSVARHQADVLLESERVNHAADAAKAIPGRLTVSFAALSAGGQWGAFGSGFLAGWRGSTNDANGDDEDRPEFMMVTGVSTGAFMAPFVFAGRAQDDDALRGVYRGLTSKDVYESRGLAALWSPSVYDTRPLKKLLEKHIDGGRLLGFIGKQARSRRLLVGAVDLDRAQFRVFDLTHQASIADEAETPARRRTCFVEAIMAAGAVPLAFPPRYIDAGTGAGLYVDGGARRHLFFRIIERTAEFVREDLRRRGVPLEVQVVAYLIVNGDVRVPISETRNSLLGIGTRSFSVVLDEGLRQSIVQSVLFARRKKWTIRGISARKVPIPSECECPPSERDEDFSACFTEWLYDQGLEMGRRRPIPWLDAKGLLELATGTQ